MERNLGTHLRETVRLAVPVAIGQLGHVMLGVTDSLMVGQLGPVPLAASSLGNSVFVLMLVLAAGISSAITPLTAIACGREDFDEAGVVFRQGLLVNSGIGILLIALSLFLSTLLDVLNQPSSVVVLAEPYLRIISFSFLPMMVFMSARNFIEGQSFTRPAMVVIILANGVNVLGNWVLIYGNLGFPALGLDGAGYSSLMVEVFSAVAIMVYVLRSKRFTRYRPLLAFHSFNTAMQLRILRIGLPSGMQYFFEAGSFSLSAVMIGWIGAKALAAHQIAISMAATSFMIILGIANAATIRVGNAVGKGDAREVRQAGFSAWVLAISLMSVAALIFIIFRNTLPTLYIDDPEVIHIASGLLIIAAVFQLSDGSQVVGHGSLRGMTDVTVPLYIAIFSYWVIGLPSGYIFAFVFDMGVKGVWLGFVFGLTTAAISFQYRFHRQSRRMAAAQRQAD
ncbi:MATE family efflux transporter [bacterium]|nr:MATE family efflux transporter [bacterium]